MQPQLTFRVTLGLQNANHDNRDDNDENGSYDGHNEIEIGDNETNGVLGSKLRDAI